jgi:hypothetical protein
LQSAARIMSDDEHDEEEKLHNSDEELHNSQEGEEPEESESFLARANRLLNESFAKNAPIYDELADLQREKNRAP